MEKETQSEEVPEFYSDGIEVNLTMPWTVGLTFSVKGFDPERKPKSLVTIRMSPEHAKVTAMILKRQLKTYEAQSGITINLPNELYSKLGLPPEDW